MSRSITGLIISYLLSKRLSLAGVPSPASRLFDSSVLATKLNGKSFQAKAPIDKVTEYGKAAFAENVILPNAGSIDFSQFARIFERIVAVLDDDKAPAVASITVLSANSAAGVAA